MRLKGCVGGCHSNQPSLFLDEKTLLDERFAFPTYLVDPVIGR